MLDRCLREYAQRWVLDMHAGCLGCRIAMAARTSEKFIQLNRIESPRVLPLLVNPSMWLPVHALVLCWTRTGNMGTLPGPRDMHSVRPTTVILCLVGLLLSWTELIIQSLLKSMSYWPLIVQLDGLTHQGHAPLWAKQARGDHAGNRPKTGATAAFHGMFEGLESTTRDFELF